MTGSMEVVVTKPRPAVTRIEMPRPERLNAMTAAMVQQLHSALAEAGADPGCRVIVFGGAGQGFCAGLDLNGYGSPSIRTRAGGRGTAPRPRACDGDGIHMPTPAPSGGRASLRSFRVCF